MTADPTVVLQHQPFLEDHKVQSNYLAKTNYKFLESKILFDWRMTQIKFTT